MNFKFCFANQQLGGLALLSVNPVMPTPIHSQQVHVDRGIYRDGREVWEEEAVIVIQSVLVQVTV